MSGIVHQPLDGCAARINITWWNWTVSCRFSYVWARECRPFRLRPHSVDCRPLPIPMSSIKFTLLSTSAKGNICGMVLPKFWIKHSRQYFGSQAGLVQNCGSCCNGKELWQKACDHGLVVKNMHQQLMKTSKNSTTNLERSGNHKKTKNTSRSSSKCEKYIPKANTECWTETCTRRLLQIQIQWKGPALVEPFANFVELEDDFLSLKV